MEEAIEYKGFEIEICRDTDGQNPQTDFDGMYPIISESGRRNENGNDYSNGDICKYLINYLSDNQVTYHQAKILKLIDMSIEDFNEYYPKGDWMKHHREQELRERLSEFILEDNENRVEYCELFNIPYFSGGYNGYSQGDYVDLFTCWTPEFGEITGVSEKDATSSGMDGSCKTYSEWCFGDVYGYNVESEDESFSDSCWGYYGDDHEESGLLEAARGAIDWHLKDKEEKRVAKLKTLIRNRVPLANRVNYQSI